jgi:electron transfer flavoprotein alpha subunit
MSVLVYSEVSEVAFQLLGKARELASDRVCVLCDEVSGDFFRYGADVVYSAGFDEYDVEGCRDAVVKAIGVSEPEVILMGATKLGKELAPRVAARIGAGCMTDCIDVFMEGDNVVTERYTYGGSMISREQSSRPVVVTVPPRTYEKLVVGDDGGEVVELDFEARGSRVEVLERRDKPKSEVDLENADIIVSAGRGFREKEDLRILEELAMVLGAQVGCSRPISADLGWMDDWVGISGRKVKPSLYVACGISGTIQHLAGIRDSRIIVAINKEEGAGIHGVSDYSIIGDIYEVLPALVKVLKEKV